MSGSQKIEKPGAALNLHVGEWVEVRSHEEIFATLDQDGSLDGLPFMPEMLEYCGKRFQVFKSAHKTADTIELFSIRRMSNAVHLQNLRCDGACHGGCQAGCLLFWKDAWLKRVPKSGAAAGSSGPGMAGPPKATDKASPPVLAKATTYATKAGEPTRYRCQATEMLNATFDVRKRQRWNPLFYVQDITSGNVSILNFIRFGLLAVLNTFLLRWFKISLPYMRGLAGDKTPTLELNLKPGELVRVKSKAEIMRTLNSRGKNRGLWFDAEMVPYCGKGNFRVLSRVTRLLNEKTGEMMVMQNPCIVLDGVTCSGNYLHRRMFSPRNELMYFREIWLERMNNGSGDGK
jgi:hypothetical protein